MKTHHGLLAGLLTFTSLLLADPVAPPPAITAFEVKQPPRHVPAPAGGPVQYSIGEPTDDEQFYLELLNRTRMNPTAEGVRLANTQDADTLGAYKFFQVDLTKFQADLAALPPLPPLAFEPRLTQAARGHSQWMFDHGLQAHNETSPAGSTNPLDVVNTLGTRITASGYPLTTAGESIFAFAASVENGHAGYEVDWGNGPGGVQNPPGHRNNNHNAAFREIGIGVLNGRNTVTNLINGIPTFANVGPQLVTFDFGARQNPQPLVTGVVYYDLNENQFYDPGEGIGGVTVSLGDNTAFALTSASGGYALPSADGLQQVTFGGQNLPATVRSAVVSGGNNLKLDLRLAYSAPLVGGTFLAALNTPTLYSTLPLPGATAYRWEFARRTPFAVTLGAEAGLGDFTTVITPGYSAVSTDSHRTGTASYHLAHLSPSNQALTLNARLRAATATQLIFATRLAAATPDETARAQVSTNAGLSWVTVWEQAGRTNNTTGTGGTIETSFTLRTNSLAAFADQEIAVRFVYDLNKSGSFFGQAGSIYGFFFDDVRFVGAEELTAFTASTLSTPSFAFTPPGAGDYTIRVGQQIGTRLFPSGPWIFVSTTAGVPPSVQLTLVTNGPGTITVNPAGGVYSPGTTVWLTATPTGNATFSGWSGGAAGSANPLPLILTTNTVVTAHFGGSFTLATTTMGQGMVSVSPSKNQYAANDVVTLTATPAAGWVFAGWSGDLGGSMNPTNLMMNTSKAVTATFQLLPSLVLGKSAIKLGPSGNLRVDFSVTSGTPAAFTLERAADPVGPYLPLAATLATNSPGNYSFKQIAPAGVSGFLRVRAQ